MAHMYQDDGYLIIPDLLDAETLALARKESVALCRGEQILCLHFPHKISPLLREQIGRAHV